MEHKIIGRRLIKSFNKLVFDEPSHTYKVVGVGLTPVSTLIKEFVKPFDSQKMSKFTAHFTLTPRRTILFCLNIKKVMRLNWI